MRPSGSWGWRTNTDEPTGDGWVSPREEENVFEAIFRVVVLVETDEQGQRLFPVTKQRTPVNETQFLSLLASVYQEEVYPTLRTDDTLTITAHLDLPYREVERMFHFREDRLFERRASPVATWSASRTNARSCRTCRRPLFGCKTMRSAHRSFLARSQHRARVFAMPGRCDLSSLRGET